MTREILRCLVFVLAAVFVFPVAASPININTADAEALGTLNGIGPKKAAAIISYRAKHGPFRSVDDLVNVPGIGAKTLDKNRAHITVDVPPPRRKYQAPPVQVYLP